MLRISQGYTVYFDHILPYLSPNSSQICPQPSPFPPSCPVCVLCSILMPLRSTYPQAHPFPTSMPSLCSVFSLPVWCVLSTCSWICIYTPECGQPTRGHTVKQTDSTFLSQKPSTVNSSSFTQVGDLWALLPPFRICLADSWGADNGFLGFFWWIPPFPR